MKEPRARCWSTTTSPSCPRSPRGADGRARFLRSAWPAVCLGLLVYANTLSNDFAYDDYGLIVDNPRIRDLRAGRAIWLSDWWQPPAYVAEADPHRDRLYRPLTVFTFALDYAAWGLWPAGYHLLNVLLHAAACGLVWLFARRLLGGSGAAPVWQASAPANPASGAGQWGRPVGPASGAGQWGRPPCLPTGERANGPTGQPALAAGRFAVHPLHVEAVAS
ncbi:MAG: hypothetical protein AB1716_17750, partial [Planctomycetota bacterium]